ncbi:Xaa-Pro aminopeptidase [Lunatimonas lonarensis]|uniref:Xaa-Pro aminopeptidase n=1 Tax=Lunatimonas lonarensis TaxID=1232681 RepID=R7ZQ94_9BACT|nr:aminopeptidase P family protein [Lunatimonas lonarensis]EON76301.1 Xaa-Pro aminopeptidase [Lunatimonas lonarensis]
MRYQPLDKDLYIRNRKKLVGKLPQNALAIFHANDVLPTNADGTMRFRQNNDLFYLTGIDQEETILVLCPNCPKEEMREILFIRKTDEHIAVWEGHKLTKEEASASSGVSRIEWLDAFEGIWTMLMALSDEVFLNTNEHLRATVHVETRDARFIKQCRERYPLHTYRRVAPLMHRLRAVKESEEVAQMQHACDITEAGFRRILQVLKPGVKEYELEAEFLHEFVRRGSKGFAYEPIIASGKNACVLHYTDNDQVCQEGDLVLFDVGAEYGNYNADMTRTLPVGGRFSKRQRQVYEAVLRVHRKACNMLCPGITIQDYHREIGAVMQYELMGLGLISEEDVAKQDPQWPAYKKYFMHGTSHHLGLDVHDVGTIYDPIEEGMVFTVEPGIYIPEEGIGIRLENNLLIQQGGNLDLMQHIPIEAEEIEELMNQGRVF